MRSGGKIGLKIYQMKRDIRHTNTRTSRLLDRIGPVGRFDEKSIRTCATNLKPMIKLFQLAGRLNKRTKDTIQNVIQNCQVCRQFKKTPPRPKVGMSKAVTTNQVVSLDSGIEDSLYLAKIVHEICSGILGKNAGQIDICLRTDSKTLTDTLQSTKQVQEKTIRHIVAWIKQQIDEKKVNSVDWVCSEDQLADVLTTRGVKTEPILSILKAGKILL